MTKLQLISLTRRYAHKHLVFSLLLAIATLSGCSQNKDKTEVVTKIIDGDTFELTNTMGETRKMDLQWIDAPEREQPFGREARQYLIDNLLNKNITMSEQNEILLEGENINLNMLSLGLAWLAPEETTFEQHFAYSEAQTEAMNSQTGFWGLEHALRIPPWVWRQQATQKIDDKMRQKYLTEKRLQEQRTKAEKQQ